MKQLFPVFRPLIVFSLLVLLAFFCFRLVLSIQYLERIRDASQFIQILAYGFRIDLSFLTVILIVPFALILLSVWVPKIQRLANQMVRIWLVAALISILFLEISTPLFVSQFDIRPNRLFIEYLGSPVEITQMLVNGFLVESILILLLTVVLGYAASRFIMRSASISATGFGYRALVTIVFSVIFALEVLIGRSGFQHRPINPAMVAVSDDRLVNSLVLNSTYSILYSAYQMSHESALKFPYGMLPDEKMIKIVKAQMDKGTVFVDGDIETLHIPEQVDLNPREKKDLIIVVEESLGASFVASLGGNPVTPNIEKWRRKSWFFDNLYATGVRSARGLEAITTGFLPTPSRAVLKLPRAQGKFFSLASYLGEAGYESTFVYGGESHFDNMKGFFLSNGFDRVVDQYDYPNPDFMGSWGVSDEDLFKRALAIIEKESSKPKFVLVFSSSNHPPFEFPDDKIELFDKDNKATAQNAAKYADYALGKFLNELELDGELRHATVLVVADHEDKVFGSEPVPHNRYRIPGFILDPDLKLPIIDKQLASQIDLPATLVSLLGMQAPNPMIGHDLTHHINQSDGRAIMQFGQNQAYMTALCIVYLQPQKEAHIDCDDEVNLSKGDLIETAIAHAQFAEYAYENEIYAFKQGQQL
ncbi:MAG: LTA synthase family protein [Gammaproteobacteria bacterium]|nr:LTA synthase family protein [Gammaproteobacteria bacterium]